METQSVRLRLVFEDRSVLSDAQRSEGMNRSWLLIEPHLHRKISDVCNHLLHIFNLRSSCPNGILLYMEGFVLPPSESTRILKDKEVICVKRKGLSLADAIEAADACNLLEGVEVNRRELVDNGMLLLANEEFDKETGGYESESEEEKMEDESSPREKVSKKRKASTKISSSKKKKHRSVVTNGVEDEIVKEEENVNSDGCLPKEIISKKIKPNKKKDNAETIIVKVESPSKVKSKKKKIKPNADEKLESSPVVKRSKQLQDNVTGVEQASTTPDGDKKVSSRSARRKKAKRKWRRELAKALQTADLIMEPKIIKSENKEANDNPKRLLKQDEVATKLVNNNMIEKEEKSRNGVVDTELVPCVVRPGHIRFEPLDEDEDAKQQIEVPDVSFQWNGITSKKKGQKWGLEKYSSFQRDDSQKATKEISTISSEITEIPLIDLNDFEKLPLYNSPKEGDVIAYRLLELTSSWTPEISSFRVGKISSYDGDNVILKPVQEYPIVIDKTDEDGPDNSLYSEDGSLEIKFAGLVDVRSVKQSNSNAIKTVSNGISQIRNIDEKDAASNLISNEKITNISKDQNAVVTNKEGNNTWEELEEALKAKKTELMEVEEEMKRDSGWNRWSYRALRGSALGPTMALLRSSNNI